MWGLSLTDWRDLLDIAMIVASLFIGLVMYKLRGTFVTKRQFTNWANQHNIEHREITDRLGLGEKEFADIRSALTNLATAEQLAELRADLSVIEERISGQTQVNLRTERLVSLMHEHMLRVGG